MTLTIIYYKNNIQKRSHILINCSPTSYLPFTFTHTNIIKMASYKPTHGAGQSSVGTNSLYEAGDQRNEPQSVLNERERYAEGKEHSHKNLDSKDERSIANKLAAQSKKSDPSHHHNGAVDQEAELSKKDPTAPVSQEVSVFCNPSPHA